MAKFVYTKHLSKLYTSTVTKKYTIVLILYIHILYNIIHTYVTISPVSTMHRRTDSYIHVYLILILHYFTHSGSISSHSKNTHGD